MFVLILMHNLNIIPDRLVRVARPPCGSYDTIWYDNTHNNNNNIHHHHHHNHTNDNNTNKYNNIIIAFVIYINNNDIDIE